MLPLHFLFSYLWRDCSDSLAISLQDDINKNVFLLYWSGMVPVLEWYGITATIQLLKGLTLIKTEAFICFGSVYLFSCLTTILCAYSGCYLVLFQKGRSKPRNRQAKTTQETRKDPFYCNFLIPNNMASFYCTLHYTIPLRLVSPFPCCPIHAVNKFLYQSNNLLL